MRNPEITREKILHESGILFNTQGYKATSLSEITDATGFTKGAIYRHFTCKEALEKESLFYLSSIMFEKMRELVKVQPTAGDKLRAMLSFFSSYVTAPLIPGGCPILNAAVEADDAYPSLREEARRILKIMQDSLTHILRKGIEYKQIKQDTDPEFYATLIVAAMEGAIMMSKLRGSDADMKKVIQHLEQQIAKLEITTDVQ